MNTTTPLCIFTAWKAGLSERDNLERMAELEDVLNTRGVAFERAEGCYEGVQEPCIIVAGRHERVVSSLCQSFEQDCWLSIDANGLAYLKGAEMGRVELGAMRALEEGHPLPSSYTVYNGVCYAAG